MYLSLPMSNNTLTANELFKRCAETPTDRNAWVEFFDRFMGDIQAAILRVLGFSRNSRYGYLFDDVMQRFNLRLLENSRRALLSFRGTTDNEARAFLRKVAARVAMNTLHDEANHLAGLKSLSELSNQDSENDDPLPSSLSSSQEDYLLLLDTIENAVSKIFHGKNRYRNIMIFKLAFVDGLTPREIAAISGLGLSRNAVEVQIHRIRKELRNHLANEEPAQTKRSNLKTLLLLLFPMFISKFS